MGTPRDSPLLYGPISITVKPNTSYLKMTINHRYLIQGDPKFSLPLPALIPALIQTFFFRDFCMILTSFSPLFTDDAEISILPPTFGPKNP